MASDVILNGREAGKDLARSGSDRACSNSSSPPKPCNRSAAREILHPAEAGLRMTSNSVVHREIFAQRKKDRPTTATMDDRVDAGLFQLSSGHPPGLRFYLCRLPHPADVDELHFPRIGYRYHPTGAQSLDAGHCAVHDSRQFSSEISGSIFPQTTPCFRRGKPRRIAIKLLWRDQAQHFA
jgi:hypothetical protein